MNLRNLLPILMFTAFMLLLVGCGGESELLDSPTPLPKPTFTPVLPTATPTAIPSQVIPTPVGTTPGIDPAREEQEALFWNEPMSSNLPKCTTDFRFSHQIAGPEDLTPISFGLGSHIAPHDHMAYWGTKEVNLEPIPGQKQQVSEKVQLYAPTDIFRSDYRKSEGPDAEGVTFVEWGGYLYACDGHQLMLGHIGEPSDEMK